MLYPGYKSFKAVKAQDIPAQQRWLHYWLVLSIVSTAMLVLQPLLSGRVPFFNMIKIVVIGALVHPKIAGYQKIYDAVVEPFIDQHMATIDTKLNQLDKATQDAATNTVRSGPAFFKRFISLLPLYDSLPFVAAELTGLD